MIYRKRGRWVWFGCLEQDKDPNPTVTLQNRKGHVGLDPPSNTYHSSVFACRLVRLSLGETRVGMSFLLIKSSVSVFPRKMV